METRRGEKGDTMVERRDAKGIPTFLWPLPRDQCSQEVRIVAYGGSAVTGNWQTNTWPDLQVTGFFFLQGMSLIHMLRSQQTHLLARWVAPCSG
jgi:hypothetical protein